ncbi:MAG: DNA mismatch repair endonuclease MutL, partial [Deltaproteobacteria bacterium]|nr:DNA mismatch repair endonuclease MutL [Deltaproteobacteria bacterium]
MASRIKVLDEKVINRIAAGEVVERPASVAKELVENAIDAHATAIRLDIEQGGRKLVRVQDNGTGMGHDDAFQALERHATSKLKSEEDLVGIATMGFRGEALASIASVSRLKLMTREQDDPAGTVITVEGGVLRGVERLGMGVGTAVEVRNLFFNVPVRRKFLKSSNTEGDHIQEIVTKFALAFPAIAFTYTEDGKIKMDAPRVGSTFERIYSLYSKDVRENLIEVNHSLDDGVLHGYVARPPYARSNMRSVVTFVNGRSVRDRVVNSAVSRAFTHLMEKGRYPLAILFIELPPDQVDVNVHPQKAEVRFVKPNTVFDLIVDGVHKALTGAPFNPPPGPRQPILPQPPYAPVSRHMRDEIPKEKSALPAPEARPGHLELPAVARGVPETETRPAPQTAAPDETMRRFSSVGILGRIPGGFLILHTEDELLIMDQHAAHERILFEMLIRSERDGRDCESQDLLVPAVLDYSPV